MAPRLPSWLTWQQQQQQQPYPNLVPGSSLAASFRIGHRPAPPALSSPLLPTAGGLGVESKSQVWWLQWIPRFSVSRQGVCQSIFTAVLLLLVVSAVEWQLGLLRLDHLQGDDNSSSISISSSNSNSSSGGSRSSSSSSSISISSSNSNSSSSSSNRISISSSGGSRSSSSSSKSDAQPTDLSHLSEHGNSSSRSKPKALSPKTLKPRTLKSKTLNHKNVNPKTLIPKEVTPELSSEASETKAAEGGEAGGATLSSEPTVSEREDGEREEKTARRFCSEGCLEGGTCDEQMGWCNCEPWKAGNNCSLPAVPACHIANWTWACDLPRPCQCALQCERYKYPSGTCFNEIRKPPVDISMLTHDDLIEGPQAHVFSNGWGLEMSRDDIEPFFTQFTSASNCPNACSSRGLCLARERACMCSSAHHGLGCEFDVLYRTFACFNSCSKRGTCVAGFCRCKEGWFGIDCSLHFDEEEKLRQLPSPPFQWHKFKPKPLDAKDVSPKVFVYELPGYFNTWFSRHLDWPEQAFFLETLLISPHRTLDAEQADYFYIPLVLRYGVMRHELILETLTFIKQHWPYFNRTNGHDHFIFTNDDWGNCELNPRGFFYPLINDIFTVTLWGFTKNHEVADKNVCFRKGVDIVLPANHEFNIFDSPIVAEAAGISPQSEQNQPPPPTSRDLLFFFVGSSARDAVPWGPKYTWSSGVRQRVFDLFEGRESETGIFLNSPLVTGSFISSMLRSEFCFAPSGWGWGIRATQAVILGCIPVVIQPDIVQAFEGDLLDWTEFAVVLGFDDIPDLPQILKGISEEDKQQKREAMKKVWPHFVWTSPTFVPIQHRPESLSDEFIQHLYENDAFATTMRVLRDRLRKRRR